MEREDGESSEKHAEGEARSTAALGGEERGRVTPGRDGLWAGAGERGRRCGRLQGAGPELRGEVRAAEGQRFPRTRCWEAGGGAGRDGKWDGEPGPWEEGRGGVGAGSRRRPDRARFLPERRPALHRGAGGGRPGRVSGKYRGPSLPRPAARCGRSCAGPAPSPAAGGGGGRRGARAGLGGREEEGLGAPVTGWQPRSGRAAAAALHLLLLPQLRSQPPPPPGEVSLPSLARSADPKRSGERGRQLLPAAGRAPGALRPRAGVGAWAAGSGPGWGRRGGGGAGAAGRPARGAAAAQSASAPGRPRWPCAPAARG